MTLPGTLSEGLSVISGSGTVISPSPVLVSTVSLTLLSPSPTVSGTVTVTATRPEEVESASSGTSIGTPPMLMLDTSSLLAKPEPVMVTRCPGTTADGETLKGRITMLTMAVAEVVLRSASSP